jgi:hypothetical protein
MATAQRKDEKDFLSGFLRFSRMAVTIFALALIPAEILAKFFPSMGVMWSPWYEVVAVLAGAIGGYFISRFLEEHTRH